MGSGVRCRHAGGQVRGDAFGGEKAGCRRRTVLAVCGGHCLSGTSQLREADGGSPFVDRIAHALGQLHLQLSCRNSVGDGGVYGAEPDCHTGTRRFTLRPSAVRV